MTEGSKFKRLNFPDPFNYGQIYKPIFPLRHHTMKAILDNIPDTVNKIYVFGSSLRLDVAVNSDLDVLFIGSITNAELTKIIRAIPEGEKADFLIETEEEFIQNLESDFNNLYRKVYEGGYKIYDKQTN